MCVCGGGGGGGGGEGGAMVLGKLPVLGRPTILITVGQGPTALAVCAGGGCLDIFSLIYPFSPFSPSLRERARYRLKYCLKGPLNPKQSITLFGPKGCRVTEYEQCLFCPGSTFSNGFASASFTILKT